MTGEPIHNIRLYTNHTTYLTLGTVNLIIRTDTIIDSQKVRNYYEATPKEFDLLVEQDMFNELYNGIDDLLYYEFMLCHLIFNTNIETTDYYHEKLSIYSPHKLNIYTLTKLNIISLFKSTDQRMWKQFVNKYDEQKLSTTVFIEEIVTASSDDEYLDNLIVVSQYINLKDKMSSEEAEFWITCCCENRNLKILKYLVEICKEINLKIDISRMFLLPIFKLQYEIVDILLNYNGPVQIKYGASSLHEDIQVTIYGVMFFHRLIIEEQIIVEDSNVIGILNDCPENIECLVYLITVFPQVLNIERDIFNCDHDSELGKCIDDIRNDNEELMKLEL